MNDSSENISSPNDIEQKNNAQNSNGKDSNQNFLSETIKFLLIAILIVAPIRFFVAEPYIVNGSSMFPTFNSADYLIIDKVSYRIDEPQRGDVIVFRFPGDTSKFFIKRVIGLPGETIKISSGDVTIFNEENPKGFELEEDYIKNHSFEYLEKKLAEDEFFVMGDNREASSDSRSWGILPRNLITGRAFIRLLPVTKIGLYPGEFNF